MPVGSAIALFVSPATARASWCLVVCVSDPPQLLIQRTDLREVAAELTVIDVLDICECDWRDIFCRRGLVGVRERR